MAIRQRFRMRHKGRVPPEASAAADHPRTLITSSGLTSLRSQVSSDTALQSRWQTAIDDFFATGGTWDATSNYNESYCWTFGAFFNAVRRPDNDLGLTWPEAWTWETTHTRLVQMMDQLAANISLNSSDSEIPIGFALTYDLLFNDIDDGRRDTYHSVITGLYNGSALSWISGSSHWDDQGSSKHVAKMALACASNDYLTYQALATAECRDYAAAHEFLTNGEGIGYSWKAQYASNNAPIFALYLGKNAYGWTKADIADRCLTAYRDEAILVRQIASPHAGYASFTPGQVKKWTNARVNFQDPTKAYHVEPLVGNHLLWSHYVLPGRVDIAPGSEYGHGNVANSEEALLGYLRHYSDVQPSSFAADRRMIRQCTNYKWTSKTSPTATNANSQSLYAMPAWLIENVQLVAAQDPETAGMARVRRWYPDSNNWITIIGGDWESSIDQSLIFYVHRRWYNNGYTEGTLSNGMWQVHRGAPLLIRRASTSHCPMSHRTYGGNGCVTFVDTENEVEGFRTIAADNPEYGGQREGNSYRKYQDIAADTYNDSGRVTHWYSSDQAVALRSDLVRSYHSTATNAAPSTPKLSAFTREFVCIQRGADGTDHERIFTYDRITAEGDGRWEFRYNLCPAMDPDIDGTETAYTPWYPGEAGVSVSEPVGATWKATGPVRWDYANATRMIVDGTNAPAPPNNGVAGGRGKVCVTWLKPSGADVAVRKRGGGNQYWDPPLSANTSVAAKFDGCPMFGQTGELMGYDGEWNAVSAPAHYQYAGRWGVEVFYASFNSDIRYLMACDVMANTGTPDTAAELTCDVNSVGARIGASAVLFPKEATVRDAGNVTIPAGVALLVITGLTPGGTRTLTAGTGLVITTVAVTASASGEHTAGGVLEVGLSGSGTLTFS